MLLKFLLGEKIIHRRIDTGNGHQHEECAISRFLGVHRCKKAANSFFPVVRSSSFAIETGPVLAVTAWQNSPESDEVLAIYFEAPAQSQHIFIFEWEAIMLITAGSTRFRIIILLARNPVVMSNGDLGRNEKSQHSRQGYDAMRHRAYLRDVGGNRIVDLQSWAGQTILFQRQVKRIQA
jgi:hypothetical protein